MHLRMTYSDIYSLPIRYRKWYIERLVEHFNDRKKAIEASRQTKSVPMGEIGPRKFS